MKNLVPKRRFEEFKDSDPWEQRKLGEIYRFQYGKFNVNPSNGGKYPVYGANGVIGLYTEFNAEDSIIIGHMGEYAGIVLWGEGRHFVTYNGIITAPRDNKVNSKFGYYLLQKKNIRQICGGSGQPFLSYEMLDKLQISFPVNSEEQKKIGTFFTELDTLITLHQRKLDKVKETKSAYLSEMFPKEGELYPKRRFAGFTDPWEQRKFSSIANLRRGLTYKPTDVREKGVIVLRSSNINEDKFVLNKDDDVFVHEQAVNIDFIKENDILITSANGSSHLVGKHALVDKMSIKAVHGGFMLAASANEPFFVNSLMSSPWYSRFIKTYIAGGNGAIGNLRRSDLEEQIVLVPNELEQQKIGTFFQQLDHLITLHQRKLDKLQALKQAYLSEMFV